MEKAIHDYLSYLHNEQQVSNNTELSYKRDLAVASDFFKKENINNPKEITEKDLNAYMSWLKKQNFSGATVSRRAASLHSFFRYLKQAKIVETDPSEDLKRPRVEKKEKRTLTADEIESLLAQPDTTTLKGIRDRAMLELLYSTGIRVSEIISLEMPDIELRRGYVVCRRKAGEMTFEFGEDVKRSLKMYFKHVRDVFLKGKESNLVFTNCSGGAMSRQGFWKMLKKYADEAKISDLL